MKLFLVSVALTAFPGGQNASSFSPTTETPVAEAPAEIPARDAAAPVSGFQVARPGDSRMTCEALLDEINTLNGELARSQTAMTTRAMDSSREMMRGPAVASAASTALSVGGGIVAALVPGAGLVLDAVQGVADAATDAAIVAHQAKQERAMANLTTEMTSESEAMTPLVGRIDRLTDISIAREC